MIRTPRPGRRGVAMSAALATAATLAGAGSVPLASATEYDGAVCAASDTRFYLNNVDGDVSVYARYWNGIDGKGNVTDLDPKTIKWSVQKSGSQVTVRPARGLRPIGGFKHVQNTDPSLGGTDTNVAWTGVLTLRTPPPGTGYELCGDDPSRDSLPWGY